MAPYNFWFALFADIEIYDIAYLLKVRKQGVPAALVRIPPANLYAVREPLTQVVTGFRAPDGKIYSPNDVMTFWGYDPAVGHGNIPPMESIRRLIAEEVASGQDREGRWRNSARKEGIIEQSAEAKDMGDEATEAFLLDVEDSLAGPMGSGRPLLLKPGQKWNDVQWSPREMEYINARKLTRLEVAAHFHIPPAMIAAAANNNEADVDTLNYFYKSSLPPRLTRVEDTFEQQLLPEFYRDPKVRRQYYVEFNMDEKLRGSFEERAAIMATTVGGPLVSVNEGRARLNMPATDDPLDDLIYQPLNSVRGGGTQASPQSPVATPASEDVGLEPAGVTPGGGSNPDKSDDPRDWVRKLDEEMGRRALHAEVRARYEEKTRALVERTFKRQDNALKGDKPFDMKRWNRELSHDLLDMLCKAAGDDYMDVYDELKAYAESKAETINDETITRGFDGRAGIIAAEVAGWIVKHHPLRRLREDAEYDIEISRRGVLVRDNWTCALCGEHIDDVPWDPTGDNSRYGTLDHVVAIENGGNHMWDNVQAAHYGCNTDKWVESRRNPDKGD